MQTYVIRFNSPKYGTISAEVVAAIEMDARNDFYIKFPDCEVLSVHVNDDNNGYEVLEESCPECHWSLVKVTKADGTLIMTLCPLCEQDTFDRL